MTGVDNGKIRGVVSLLVEAQRLIDPKKFPAASHLTPQDIENVLEVTEKFCRATTLSRYPVHHPGCQYNEFPQLRKYLGDNVGTYVDVGAGRPQNCSNTWQLYQKGWRGLLIEPLPIFWLDLLQTRPGDYLWPLPISGKNQRVMYRIAGELSSCRPDWPIGDVPEIAVDAYPMSEVLDHFPTIRNDCQLCSIDVEGFEKRVLSGIDFNTFRPNLFIIEYRAYDPETRGQDTSNNWQDMLTWNGYKPVWKGELNAIYKHESV